MVRKGDLFALEVDGEKCYLIEHLKNKLNEVDLVDFEEKYVNNEHELPRDSCFRGYPSFKICSIIGIFHKEAVYNRKYGVLIRKEDAELYDRAESEYHSLSIMNSMAYETLSAVRNWNKLRKYVLTYKKIRKRIDEDE